MTLGIARINDSNRAVEILPTNEHMNITYVCFSTEDDELLNRLNSCGLRGKSYILNHNKWIYIYVYVLITWTIIIISVNYSNLIDYPLRCSYDWKTPERKRKNRKPIARDVMSRFRKLQFFLAFTEYWKLLFVHDVGQLNSGR